MAGRYATHSPAPDFFCSEKPVRCQGSDILRNKCHRSTPACRSPWESPVVLLTAWGGRPQPRGSGGRVYGLLEWPPVPRRWSLSPRPQDTEASSWPVKQPGQTILIPPGRRLRPPQGSGGGGLASRSSVRRPPHCVMWVTGLRWKGTPSPMARLQFDEVTIKIDKVELGSINFLYCDIF